MPELPKQTIDLTGQTFGQLLVLAYSGRRNRQTFWTCKCLACGSVKDYRAGNLRTGLSTACHRCPAKKERKWDRPIYMRWRRVIGTGEVCKRWLSFEKFVADMGEPPKDKRFLLRPDATKPYGPGNCVWAENSTLVLTHTRRVLAKMAWSRAVRVGQVCERWCSFETFVADMGEPPEDKPCLLRIDSTKPYKPGNCAWAPRGNVRLLTHNGRTMSLSGWAKELGISHQAMFLRLKKMPVHEALTRPVRKRYAE